MFFVLDTKGEMYVLPNPSKKILPCSIKSFSLSFLVVLAISLFFLPKIPALTNVIDIQGDFNITDNTGSSVYSFANDILTIESGDVTLSTTKQTNQRIVVGTANTAGEVRIHLDNVDIQTSASHALQILDNATFNVFIEILDGTESTLDASQANESSGIQKANSENINSGILTLYGKGKLIAKGGQNGCGIGASIGLYNYRCEKLSIQELTIEAEGQIGGAGIGTTGTDVFFSSCSIENAHIRAKGRVGIGSSNWGFLNSSIKNSSIVVWGEKCGIGSSTYKLNISNSTITAYASQATSGSLYGAGIGGGLNSSTYGDATEINIADSIIYAYGGKGLSGSAGAGIGGISEGDESSGNSISGNSLVYAASGGDAIDALRGFDTSDLTGGIIFEGVVSNYTDNPFENPYKVSWKKGTIYGDTTLSKAIAERIELPAITTIDTNATFKVADDSHLTIPDAVSLQNDGNLSSLDNITIEDGGLITTSNNFYLKDATTPSTSNYEIYLNHTGIIQQYSLVPALPQNYIHGWFSSKDGTGTQVYNGRQVELNTHNFYEVESEAYQIQVPDVEHGTISVNKEYAYQGDKVSFTLISDDGYKLKEGTLIIKDEKGNIIDHTYDNNTYSFIMPSFSVSISAVFEPASFPEHDNGWSQDELGWQYYIDGKVTTGWLWIDDTYGAHWYYFNEDTYMAASQWQWDEENSSWYWLCSSGTMICGLWQWIGNEWYGFWWNGKMCRGWVWDADWQKWFYCYNDGVMARSVWIGRYWLNWQGIWIH